MKKQVKKVFSIILSVIILLSAMSISVFAGGDYYDGYHEFFTEGDYTYMSFGEGVAIVGTSYKLKGDIVIPSKLGGYPVVEIAEWAFPSHNITSITIPNTVNRIAWCAIASIEKLNRIFIPDSVVAIEFDVIPLSSCIIDNIVVGSNNQYYYTKNGCLIEKETKTVIAVCKNYTIPTDGSVINIGKSAFAGRSDIKNLTVPKNIKSIGMDAFFNCDSLVSVKIPKSVTECWGAFQGCSKLESITVESGNKVYHSSGNCLIQTDSKELIAGCKNSVIPTDGSVTSIGYGAFYGCSELTSILIPNPVTLIDYYAFYECWWLERIIISASVTSIGEYAFCDCWELKDVYYTGTEQKKNAVTIDNDYEGNYCLLDAKWHYNFKTSAKYNITYNLNGGKNNKDNPKTYTFENDTITLKNPTRKGYTFKGWYTGSKKVTSIVKGSIGNITLTAKWEKNTYKIKYKLNSGKNSSKNPTKYVVTTSTITLKNPTRKGYTFDGWYSGSKKVTKIKKGSTGNITLTAKWSKITYKITYKLAGGKKVKNPTKYTVTTSTIKLKNPTKKGYTFKGWYNGSKKVTQIKKGSTGNITLTAKWKKK